MLQKVAFGPNGPAFLRLRVCLHAPCEPFYGISAWRVDRRWLLFSRC